MNKSVKILIIEDSEDDAKLALRALRGGGFEPTHRRVQSAADLKAVLAGEHWDAVISDFSMPGFTGMDALEICRAAGLDIPFILISGTIGEDIAVQAMKAGASDYLMKQSLARLASVLERELKETQMRAAHRQAQEALADSETRFRQMAENIRDVFFLQDAESRHMVYVSPAYAEIWGRSCASLQADPESWAAAIHPDDRAAADADYLRGVSTGKFESEYRIIRPDGAIRWIEARGFPVHDTVGKLVRIAGIASDISERKQGEEVLQRFAVAMDAIVDGIFLTDRSTMSYLYVNDAACRQQNLTREELLALGPMKLLSKSRAEVEREYDEVIAAGVNAEPFELLWSRPDGSPLWVELRRQALRSGDRWTMVTLVRDITARKQAEQELRESERRFSDMLGNVELISLMLDREARITYCNDYLLLLTGWQLEEVIGRNWFELFIPDDSADAKDVFGAALLNLPSAWHHENQIRTRSGERRLIRWNNSVLRSANGDVIGVASIGEDITEQRRGEARILRLNRVYAVQSGINALIVRVHDREELFGEACRIAVEAGAFRTAWIGVIDPDTLDGQIVAWYGADHDFISSIKLAPRSATADSEAPACRALRLGQTVICNDIATEPSLAPHREVLLQRGYQSLGCFALMLDGRPEAVIALFAGEPDFFDAEEVKLLADLAANLSFALDNLEHEKTLKKIDAQRRQGEQEILATKTRLQGMLDAIPDLLFELGLDGRYYAYHSPRSELLAAPVEELLGRTVGEVLPADAADIVLAALREANTTGRSTGKQFKLAFPQGGLWFELSVARMAMDRGQEPRFICLSRDITERKQAELELRESESRFRGLTALSTDWYWQQDETLRFVQFSGGDRVKGWGADQQTWVGKQRWEISGIMPLDGDWTEHKALLQARKPFRNFEYQRRDADGALRYVTASGEPIFGPDGTFAGYRGVATDITERKAAENRIRRLNRVYAVLSGINTLIVRVHDRDELFREACRIAVDAGGFRMSMLCMVDPGTMKIEPLASAGKDDGLFAAIKEILASPDTGPKSMVGRAIAQKAAIVSNDLRNDSQLLLGKHYRDAAVRSLAVLPLVVADIAIGALVLYSEETDFFDEEEMKLLTELAGDIGFAIDYIGRQKRLDFMAYYDELTGLANRKLFLDRVTQYMHSAASGGHKLAVFLIDLERFKNINDSLGRAGGDALLRLVAESLTRNAAGDANLVARVGADQFALVMPEVKREGTLVRLLEKWIEAFINQPFHLNDAVFRIAHKTGIALFPDDGADAETLFRNAEAALKQAKATGERYLFYTQQMNAGVAVRVTLENRLRQALDNNEFVLHYQPKVNLATGKMIGAEALIRWNDSRTGLVPPVRFIPVLEEIGLIHDVGRWALRRAIADYLRWRAAGLPAVRIAVNVSPLQLRQRGFVAEIEQAIAIDPQAAAGLELEITESVIMEDIKHNIASLQAVRDMGISVAIDDFGTGFSSLSYLARLPVDTLKIDRSFVIDMTAGPQGLALVSTIIKLAHSLKLMVVAEGVETEEQRRLLLLLGCDEMQGYLFSKPVSGDIFEARFLNPKN